jgi:hypothetical protein
MYSSVVTYKFSAQGAANCSLKVFCHIVQKMPFPNAQTIKIVLSMEIIKKLSSKEWRILRFQTVAFVYSMSSVILLAK